MPSLTKNMIQECQQAIKFFHQQSAKAEAKALKTELDYLKGLNDGIEIGYNCAAGYLESIVKHFEKLEDLE